MPHTPNWQDLGPAAELRTKLTQTSLTELHAGDTRIALSHVNGVFGAVSAQCNHAGGPLGKGTLDGEYIVCPWHHWKFHRLSGQGEPGYEKDCVPRYELKEEGGHLWIDLNSATQRNKVPHPPHPLTLTQKRDPASPLRVAGISTTVMEKNHPRYSTSLALLETALESAKSDLGCDTRLLKLSDLNFRNCEGFYSKGAGACTWPCSITQMDEKDQMVQVYDALVQWADVVLIATPIRWGAASSLYFRMAERLNCVQNQITLHNRVLIQNKVASFIITGGQDNVQAVAGQMLGFFAEIGFQFPTFPFIAHSLGWTAENMERNMNYVAQSQELKDGARALVKRSVDFARLLREHPTPNCDHIERAGRKARRLEPKSEAVARG